MTYKCHHGRQLQVGTSVRRNCASSRWRAANTNSSRQRRNYPATDRCPPGSYVRRSPNWTSSSLPYGSPRPLGVGDDRRGGRWLWPEWLQSAWQRTTACCHKLPSIVHAHIHPSDEGLTSGQWLGISIECKTNLKCFSAQHASRKVADFWRFVLLLMIAL